MVGAWDRQHRTCGAEWFGPMQPSSDTDLIPPNTHGDLAESPTSTLDHRHLITRDPDAPGRYPPSAQRILDTTPKSIACFWPAPHVRQFRVDWPYRSKLRHIVRRYSPPTSYNAWLICQIGHASCKARVCQYV